MGGPLTADSSPRRTLGSARAIEAPERPDAPTGGTPVGTLFDIPQSLALILSLAAGGVEQLPRDVAVSAPVTAAAARDELDPYAFTEQAWLAALKSGAGRTGELAGAESAVFRTSSGRYYVPSETERRRILAARKLPAQAAAVAFDLARRNAVKLAPAIGRRPTPADLYLAHVLGTQTAIGLILLVTERPSAPARLASPDLHSRLLEYPDARGKALSAGDLYERVAANFEVSNSPAGPAPRLLAPLSRWAAALRKGDLRAEVPGQNAAGLAKPASLEWAAEIQVSP